VKRHNENCWGRPAQAPAAPLPLFGEIFISVDDAVAQARQFRTTWPAELVRYVIHGILHLRGYDDLTPAARRTMKKEENRLLSGVRRGFPLSKLKAPPTLSL
jgi:probable rRNA maturation factor